MPAGTNNFVIEQGATFDITMTYYTDESEQTPVDLTGYSARMTIKEKVEGTTILELTSDAGEIVLGDDAGTIQILVAASVTANLDFEYGVYDLELVTGSTVERLLQGQVTLSKNVTT